MVRNRTQINQTNEIISVSWYEQQTQGKQINGHTLTKNAN